MDSDNLAKLAHWATDLTKKQKKGEYSGLELTHTVILAVNTLVEQQIAINTITDKLINLAVTENSLIKEAAELKEIKNGLESLVANFNLAHRKASFIQQEDELKAIKDAFENLIPNFNLIDRKVHLMQHQIEQLENANTGNIFQRIFRWFFN